MKRQDLSAVVAIAGAIAIAAIMLVPEEYAKYLPATVWLAGVIGLICYLGEDGEDGRR